MPTVIKPFFCLSPLVFCCALMLYDPQEARSQVTPIIDSLLHVLEKQDPDLADPGILSELAIQYTDVDPVTGMKYARQAKELAIRRGTPVELARATNAVASSFLMMMEVDSAIRYYDEALVLYNEQGDKKGMGDIAGNKGHAAYHIGRYDEALKYYFESLGYFEEVGFQPGITNQHASLGNGYMAQEKYPEALHHDSLALEGFTLLGDSMACAMVLGNMANIYSDARDYKKAESYFKRTVDIYNRTTQPFGVGRNLNNLAGMYNDLGRCPEALEAAREALKISSANNIDIMVFYAYSNIGLAYLESYQYRDSIMDSIKLIPGDPQVLLDSAIHNLEKAATLTDRLEAPQDFEKVHRVLSKAYKYNGQFEKALKHYEIYAILKDSLSSLERSERIEQLTTEREIAVRNKQIELDKLQLKVKRNERVYFIIGLILLAGGLIMVFRNAVNQRKSNQQLGLLNTRISTTNLQLEDRNVVLTSTLKELKETQAQLIEAERQKENEILRRRISRDIHDDISSGLSKISWMTELLRSKPDAGAPEDADMLNRIASYSRETVSKLGEIIWSTKPESDNFSGLASYCREFLNKYLAGLPIKYQFNFTDQGDETAMNPELRRNLYLVMKEAVHNAVKYSQAKDLNILMEVRDGTYRLVVEDNGIGMDASQHSPNGNGFRNMQGRMTDVNGIMIVRTAPGKGTRLEFSGPVY